jgi:hypothetical protein
MKMDELKRVMLEKAQARVVVLEAKIKRVWPLLSRARRLHKRLDSEYGSAFCEMMDAKRFIHENTKGITKLPPHTSGERLTRRSKPKLLTEDEIIALAKNMGQDMLMALMEKLGEKQ